MDGWKTLLPKEWASCVKLHNLPFCFIKTQTQKINISKNICSIYELSKSAKNWSWGDFKDYGVTKLSDVSVIGISVICCGLVLLPLYV